MQVVFEPDREIDDALIVRLQGAVDVITADRLWELASQRASASARFFLFDFSGVTILTSAGIGMLVRLLIRLRGQGGTLAVFGCNDHICDVFDIVLLKEILHVSASEDEAREKLKSG
ncbi:MAG: STAS domain-containing protein [Thermoanaerobaculales bacterium]|nr:STAS domain-containing protein [Thermoanaerobaculales bacterium]